MSEIRSAGVTAFDFFGIFLPGCILVLAIRVGLAPVYGPIGSSYGEFNYADWIGLAFAAYIAGHLAQLIGRLVARLNSLLVPWRDVFRLSVDLSDQPETALALERIREYLQWRTGLDLQRLADVTLSNLTDEFLEQYGTTSTLASYRSREVYYRGLSGAMLLLGVAFGSSLYANVHVISGLAFAQPYYLNSVSVLLCVVVVLAANDAYRRQRRRRMRHSLLGYLVLETGGRLATSDRSQNA